MKVPDRLLNHFQDPRFHDRPTNILLPGDDRLSHETQTWEGNWEGISREVMLRDGIAWFPDANVAILHDTEPVWTALRLAALGSSTTIISSAVETEIKEWLGDPYRNKTRAHALREALENGTWARRLALPRSIYSAVAAYARLLGLRRMLCLASDERGRTILGTDPSDKSETMNKVTHMFGPRAIGLAKKGRQDAEANKPINILDEYHCVMAIAHAITTGTETVILTADADHLEVFRKAQWFVNAHYRAWAAASRVKRGDYGTPEVELPASETRGFFDGPLTLYRRPTNRLAEALPAQYTPVQVHVVYVGPDNRTLRMATWFEREMLAMFEIRSKFARCTDLFAEQNIHIDLSPINTTPTGWLIGIGRDSTEVYQDSGRTSILAALDIEHAITCRERIGG